MSYPYQIKSVQHYHEQYQKSINDPTSFWSEIADNFVWHKITRKIKEPAS